MVFSLPGHSQVRQTLLDSVNPISVGHVQGDKDKDLSHPLLSVNGPADLINGKWFFGREIGFRNDTTG